MHRVSIDSIYVHSLKSLRDQFKSTDTPNNANAGGFRPYAYSKTVGKEDFILHDLVRKHHCQPTSDAFVRAGARSKLHFDPTKVKAAIVTCGGLCPGLNNVIRELVHSLVYLYNVDSVIGIRCVYSLFIKSTDHFSCP